MVEQQEPTAYVNPYKFNAKELDSETGLYYYGARYYNPRISIWYGVDPLAVYNPVMETQFYGDGQHNGGSYFLGNNNPYIYCYQNPIKYVDPNGKQNYSSIISGKFSALGRAIDDGIEEVASQVITRGFGGLQMVGGATETVIGGVGGLLTAETGVGAVIGAATLANGIDNTVTGAKQLWTGKSENTYLHKGVSAGSKALGADEETAENIATGADLATLALGGGNSLKNTKILRESGTGKINGISKGIRPGYGAQRRFDIHPLERASRKTSKLTLADWIKNNKIPVPHYHRGKGSNLKYHRPWEKGPDGKRRW